MNKDDKDTVDGPSMSIQHIICECGKFFEGDKSFELHREKEHGKTKKPMPQKVLPVPLNVANMSKIPQKQVFVINSVKSGPEGKKILQIPHSVDNLSENLKKKVFAINNIKSEPAGKKIFQLQVPPSVHNLRENLKKQVFAINSIKSGPAGKKIFQLQVPPVPPPSANNLSENLKKQAFAINSIKSGPAGKKILQLQEVPSVLRNQGLVITKPEEKNPQEVPAASCSTQEVSSSILRPKLLSDTVEKMIIVESTPSSSYPPQTPMCAVITGRYNKYRIEAVDPVPLPATNTTKGKDTNEVKEEPETTNTEGQEYPEQNNPQPADESTEGEQEMEVTEEDCVEEEVETADDDDGILQMSPDVPEPSTDVPQTSSDSSQPLVQKIYTFKVKPINEVQEMKEHVNAAEHFCGVCGKMFKVRDVLLKHMLNMHTRSIEERQRLAEMGLSCDVCGKKYEVQDDLSCSCIREKKKKKKQKYVKPKPVQCEICNKTVSGPQGLIYHRRTHTGERPHQCKYCPKAYPTPMSLQIHIRTHTGERPYKCSQCEKTFASPSAIQKHLRVHTGEKPYPCPLCGKCFTQSNGVKLHVKTVHLKQPAPYRRKRVSKKQTIQKQVDDDNQYDSEEVSYQIDEY